MRKIPRGQNLVDHMIDSLHAQSLSLSAHLFTGSIATPVSKAGPYANFTPLVRMMQERGREA